jgi:hypothetical protein
MAPRTSRLRILRRGVLALAAGVALAPVAVVSDTSPAAPAVLTSTTITFNQFST